MIIFFIILIDQVSKTTFIYLLKTKSNYTIPLLPFFDIVYVWNYGLSFGLFRNYYQYSNIVFLILNTFIVIYLIYFFIKNTHKYTLLSLSFIIGGAIGNLVDRYLRGAVFDFIYLHYGNFHYPVFNMADSFVTIGAIILFIQYIYQFSKE